METTRPGTPQSDKEHLIATALARAVIEEKDVPCYDWVPDTSKVVVVNAIGMDHRYRAHEYFTAGALPHSSDVDFTLLSPKQLKQRLVHRGEFVFVHVEELHIDGDYATISISLNEAGSEWDLVGGWVCCYVLEYLKIDGKWQFNEIVDTWGIIF
jgi:hypothetical protein